METAVAIIVAFITAVIGPTVLEWVKVKLTKPSKIQSPIKEAIDLNEKVDEQLDIIMDEFQCDRIWIAQFHNGGHFYPTGKSIQKFSLFYEKVSPKVESIQHTFQNIPVSLFPKALSKLYNDGEIAIYDYNEDETYGLELFDKEYDCKSFYLLEIDDLNGRFIGIMGISFIEEPYKFSKEDWIFIRHKLGAIDSLLTDYLHNKK